MCPNYTHGHGEFNKLVADMTNVIINTCASRENVAEVEKRIRVTKERAQAEILVLPYKYIPNVMTIILIHFCVFWLNMMPIKSGYSKEFCPRELIGRQQPDTNWWGKLQ